MPTIRSRTHHYPFRLIPPRLLSQYLGRLCDKEGVSIEAAALPLVVRAGAGSARDTSRCSTSCSAGRARGRDPPACDGAPRLHPRHPARRGRRRFAAGDGAAVFGVVDKVIETGRTPAASPGPAPAAARPGDRRGGARRRRPGSSTSPGPGRAAGRPAARFGPAVSSAARRHGRRGPHRDAGRHGAADAAGAAVRADPPARRRPCHRRVLARLDRLESGSRSPVRRAMPVAPRPSRRPPRTVPAPPPARPAAPGARSGAGGHRGAPRGRADPRSRSLRQMSPPASRRAARRAAG